MYTCMYMSDNGISFYTSRAAPERHLMFALLAELRLSSARRGRAKQPFSAPSQGSRMIPEGDPTNVQLTAAMFKSFVFV